MKVAFYAPLKSPRHPTPSGDREIARLLMKALRHGGHEVAVASDLRSYEGGGDRARQAAIRDAGIAEANRLIDRFRGPEPGPDVWLTYHVYHRAPDWIGPMVCERLGIPYVVAEASVSPKAADGPWSEGHRHAIHCIGRAAAMLALNPRDVECAAPYLDPEAPLVLLRPFVEDTGAAAVRPPGGADSLLRIVAVAMMRPGDKQRSWEDLAGILRRLPSHGWRLDTVGDGAAAAPIRGLLDAAADGLHHHGRLEPAARDRVLDESELILWPARNEAMGMALLEAQARGLAVIAGREGGVAGVVCHGIGGLLYPPGDLDTAARYVRYLLDHREALLHMRRAARRHVLTHHHIATASRNLDRLVCRLCAQSS